MFWCKPVYANRIGFASKHNRKISLMSEASVEWKRRTQSPVSFGGSPFRTVTPRQRITRLTFEDSTSPEEGILKPTPTRVKTMEDEQTPIEIEVYVSPFITNSKKTASLVLRTVGIKRDTLKKSMNKVYESFFYSLNRWNSSRKGAFMRKLNEPQQSLESLSTVLSNANLLMAPLMVECHKWTKCNPFVPPPLKYVSDDSSMNEPEFMENLTDINLTIRELDRLSIRVHKCWALAQVTKSLVPKIQIAQMKM